MTWNPLKKNYLTQRPTFVPPLLSYAEDNQLDLVVQRLIYVEDAIRKLTKEMKKYIGALENLDRADQRLSTNLINCGLAQNNDEYRRIVEEYSSVVVQVGKNVHEMTGLCHRTFVEPLKKLRGEFAAIAAAVAKREELAAAWRYSHNRAKKLQEKRDRTASHVAKLERERRAEEAAAKELRAAHAQLLRELPTFLEKRLEYISPSVHAIIAIQLNYYGHATQLYTLLMPVQRHAECASAATVPDEEYERTINAELNRLRSLAIVKDG